MLAYIVAAFGVLIVLIGITVAAVPAATREIVSSMQSTNAVYGLVGFRIVAGAFFVFASEACAWPNAVGMLGVLMLAAGFVGLFMGVERLRAMINWALDFSDTAFRAWSPAAILFGVFVVYAAV